MDIDKCYTTSGELCSHNEGLRDRSSSETNSRPKKTTTKAQKNHIASTKSKDIFFLK